MHERNSSLGGVDVSATMLKIARSNVRLLENIALVEADGLKLPFHDGVIGIVITRLAKYSINEAYRVLGDGGFFFKYGLGPDADKEIVEFFPDRVERDNFFFPKSPEGWRKEVCQDIVDAYFTILDIKDYVENDYYKDEDELMGLIEMVPLVKEFDRIKDRRTVHELAEKYRERQGIKITWHYYIVVARKTREIAKEHARVFIQGDLLLYGISNRVLEEKPGP
jgi:SAM-dependent methyltransferase